MRKIFTIMAVLVVCFVFNSCEPQEMVYEGNLEISTISDLLSVSKYSSITGDLEISQDLTDSPMRYFTNINAFRNLTHVGGSVLILVCPKLRNLYGLKNLKSIGGSLQIMYNAALTNLDGLKQLESIPKRLVIEGNSNLNSIVGLRNVTSVGMDISIRDNDSLTTLAGLENIAETVDIDIQENAKLRHLNLDKLNCVSDDFYIYSNFRLPESEIAALKDQVLAGNGIGGDITIKYNYDDSYPGPVWFGSCVINNREDLDKLSEINYVTGDLYVRAQMVNEAIDTGGAIGHLSSDIVDFKGIESLTRVGRSLAIGHMDNLTSLAGLENLAFVGHYLEISENPALISLTGFENISSIGGNLEIIDDDSLISLAGLKNLTAVGGVVNIQQNNALTSLNLDSLCYVGLKIGINYNPNLCNSLAHDLKGQVETCPGGGITGDTSIGTNKDCSAP